MFRVARPMRRIAIGLCESAWIAELLEHGLLKGSFIPPIEIRDLRDWTRDRRQLVKERTSEVNRLRTL